MSLMFSVALRTNPKALVALVHWYSTCLDHVKSDDVKIPRSRSQSEHSKIVINNDVAYMDEQWRIQSKSK